MLEPEAVTTIVRLSDLDWASKRIAKELGVRQEERGRGPRFRDLGGIRGASGALAARGVRHAHPRHDG